MINKPTYQIVMSTDGQHKVVVTFEDPAGSQAAIAAARGIYGQLNRDDLLAEAADQAESLEADEPPLCGRHQIPMVLVNGKKGQFWSCHQKNSDRTWCNYKPSSRSGLVA